MALPLYSPATRTHGLRCVVGRRRSVGPAGPSSRATDDSRHHRHGLAGQGSGAMRYATHFQRALRTYAKVPREGAAPGSKAGVGGVQIDGAALMSRAGHPQRRITSHPSSIQPPRLQLALTRWHYSPSTAGPDSSWRGRRDAQRHRQGHAFSAACRVESRRCGSQACCLLDSRAEGPERPAQRPGSGAGHKAGRQVRGGGKGQLGHETPAAFSWLYVQRSCL